MQKRMKLLKNQKGMTLVELLAVLVIIGIIAAIAVPMIGNVIQNSKERAVLSDASSIISGAQLAYANDEGDEDTASDGITYKKSTLEKYVEGIELGSNDEVVYVNSTWKIKYKKLIELKDKLGEDKFETGDYMTSDQLNKLLKKE
ncbi:type II secretion system protein [Caldifermentibacillus hisashii]|uniref:type II secretion system protein n=1 Tax=Caldifermentibacillus hisashii TaxID=996558 RepID=UPI0031012F52